MKNLWLFAILVVSVNAFGQANLNRPGNNLKPAGLDLNILRGTDKPQALIQLYDSIYEWQWDTINAVWSPEYKQVSMFYDMHNNLVSEVREKWDSTAWVNDVKTISTFNAANEMTNGMSQTWSNGAWKNCCQDAYTWDENGNRLSYVSQLFIDSTWRNIEKTIWTYDSRNNRTTVIGQSWNDTAWRNVSQSVYSYDAENNQTGKVYQTWGGDSWINAYQLASTYTSGKEIFVSYQVWSDNAWQNYWQETNVFDVLGNLASTLIESWKNSSWQNSYYDEYSYDIHNNQISRLMQTWDSNAWVNTKKYSYTYNADHFQTSGLTQIWIGSKWENSGKYTNSYDIHNNNTGELWYTWNGNAWIQCQQSIIAFDVNDFIKSGSMKNWKPDGITVSSGDSTIYYYHSVEGMDNLSLTGHGINVYPNPNYGKFTIASTVTITSIEVFNLQGERIYEDFTGSHTTLKQIVVPAGRKGIFFIRIGAGTKMYTRKIVIQ